ncbi:MAG: Holliday junction resolvase RecU [Allobaculum sp.]|nr:Holliday junction resolvase RecU [Allobaculum sp.]
MCHVTNSIQYPNKLHRSRKSDELESKGNQAPLDNHSSRGTSLEDDLNASNLYYKDQKTALIYKKPTPIQVVRVDYPARNRAKITEAYYRTPSTTDYNGLYKGHYIDFEAKQTQNPNLFPKYLVQPHQIEHLKLVHEQGGIGFFIIRFTSHKKTFLVDALKLIEAHETIVAKSIPYPWFEEHGILLREGLYPRIHYLEAVDKHYLSSSSSLNSNLKGETKKDKDA